MFIHFDPVNPCLEIYSEGVLKDEIWNIYSSIHMKALLVVVKMQSIQISKNKEISDVVKNPSKIWYVTAFASSAFSLL